MCHAPGVVHHALLRWLVTQGETPQMEMDQKVGLIADPRLHACRAPGMTCLAALKDAQHFGAVAQNRSKGCGTIMRMAPVAFIGGSDPREMAVDCSALTHGHPTAGAAAAAFVEILRGLISGATVEDAALAALANTEGETALAIQRALAAPADGGPETIESLGGGWVAEEALSIALYAARVAPDFATGIQIATCHSGDSDSTGSIAGNLLGLRFPGQVLHDPLAERIECADRIAWLAQDIEIVTNACAHLPEDFDARYPGM